TAMPSRTPPGEPGRFTTRLDPARPAIPRDNAAVATPLLTPYARTASASPGTSTSTTRLVASGVVSVGARPVPPVVTTTSYLSATAARSAPSTRSPSGTTQGPSTCAPTARSPSTTIGPPRSGYTPVAARVDTVITTALIRRVTPVARYPIV